MEINEIETRSFLEDAVNLCISIQTNELEQKQYIIGFNVIKDYETVNNNLVIGNGKYKALNLIIDWINVKIIKNKLVIPICNGSVTIEEF